MATQNLIPIVIGGVFIILGLGAWAWGRREERQYYDSLTTHTDLREFFTRWPFRPEPGAIKVGGWIAIAIGVGLSIVGLVFALTA